jgi:hypothetical protein
MSRDCGALRSLAARPGGWAMGRDGAQELACEFRSRDHEQAYALMGLL